MENIDEFKIKACIRINLSKSKSSCSRGRQDLQLVFVRKERQAALLRRQPQGNGICSCGVRSHRVKDRILLRLQTQRQQALLRRHPRETLDRSTAWHPATSVQFFPRRRLAHCVRPGTSSLFLLLLDIDLRIHPPNRCHHRRVLRLPTGPGQSIACVRRVFNRITAGIGKHERTPGEALPFRIS